MGAKSTAKVVHIYEIHKFFFIFSSNQIKKLSKIKMQTAHYKRFADFINTKKFSVSKNLPTTQVFYLCYSSIAAYCPIPVYLLILNTLGFFRITC